MRKWRIARPDCLTVRLVALGLAGVGPYAWALTLSDLRRHTIAFEIAFGLAFGLYALAVWLVLREERASRPAPAVIAAFALVYHALLALHAAHAVRRCLPVRVGRARPGAGDQPLRLPAERTRAALSAGYGDLALHQPQGGGHGLPGRRRAGLRAVVAHPARQHALDAGGHVGRGTAGRAAPAAPAARAWEGRRTGCCLLVEPAARLRDRPRGPCRRPGAAPAGGGLAGARTGTRSADGGAAGGGRVAQALPGAAAAGPVAAARRRRTARAGVGHAAGLCRDLWPDLSALPWRGPGGDRIPPSLPPGTVQHGAGGRGYVAGRGGGRAPAERGERAASGRPWAAIALAFVLRPAAGAEAAVRRCIWPVGAFTLLTQNLFPWYMLWLLPLLALYRGPARGLVFVGVGRMVPLQRAGRPGLHLFRRLEAGALGAGCPVPASVCHAAWDAWQGWRRWHAPRPAVSGRPADAAGRWQPEHLSRCLGPALFPGPMGSACRSRPSPRSLPIPPRR